LETYQWVKIALSIGMVVLLSFVAERSGPRMAGILAGYPLGIAIALFFIGYEISPEFAARSAVFTQAGLICNLWLTAGYLLGQKLPGIWGLTGGSVLGVAAFMLAGSLLQWVPGQLPVQLALTALAVAAFSFAYRALPEHSVQRRPMTLAVMLLRGVIAAAIVLLVTALAHVLPDRWAGLLAGFPFTMYPLLVLMHLGYGPHLVVAIVKHYPEGLGSLMVYALVVALSYVPLGIYWGTALGYLAATLYLGTKKSEQDCLTVGRPPGQEAVQLIGKCHAVTLAQG
jgi:hypothetical protein